MLDRRPAPHAQTELIDNPLRQRTTPQHIFLGFLVALRVHKGDADGFACKPRQADGWRLDMQTQRASVKGNGIVGVHQPHD